MNSFVRLLVVLVASAAAACSSIPLIGGPGSMDLEVRGVALEDVVSVYVVVADEADLADLDDPRTIDKVVRPERQAKYVTFGQFKPVPGETWKLEQRSLAPTHKLVDVEVAKKAPDVAVEIDRKLLESRPQLCAAVIVNCGDKGWAASPKIASAEIDNTGKVTLEIRSNAVTRVGP